ncbi:type II toxin-antitoxin system RelE/ParE family toxin [Salicibibacter kimchii]|uniref:Type II toxin-antitoxin system RelE/ParE family toxin n=1 Tax=Salicibibacter kimchii TaxID=2099786 RepID=A0A345BW22_9BACI|nr:type II toxin-antitoxin system RelE/ParE family toxin [Salicibibacter kimchii]AXF55153.1 type II toxin-antitoxin system RelE/ParE family toxin [Salicibibacter kimchii]
MVWAKEAKKSFSQIKSIHFTESETNEYKEQLLIKIRNKILSMMEAMPAHEPEWKGNYRVLVDNYKVFYSFSNDKEVCTGDC